MIIKNLQPRLTLFFYHCFLVPLGFFNYSWSLNLKNKSQFLLNYK